MSEFETPSEVEVHLIFAACVVLVAVAILWVLAYVVLSIAVRVLRARAYDRELLAAALKRYDADQQEAEAQIESIRKTSVPVIALVETREGTIGVGADGELVEVEPDEASGDQ